MPNLFCGFGVWLSWSIIVVKMQQMHDLDPTVYSFADWGSPTGADYNQLLATIPAVAGLSGGILRICNSFVIQLSGGRNVVASNTILLMIPMIMAAAKLSDPNVSFLYLLACAILSGIGGGHFASSMSNISFLYPKTQQGYALGFNGGLGNLGVSMTQLLLPETMAWAAGQAPLTAAGVPGWPHHAGWFWWPICLVSGIAAWLWMSNMPQHGNYFHKSGSSKHNTTFMATVWNLVTFYWIEFTGLCCAAIMTAIFLATRNLPVFSSPGGGVAHKFILVLVAVLLEHAILWCTSPKFARTDMWDQCRIFQDKHTAIMTVLYTMSFGSFIGFSGAFPRLIQDLFGYLTIEGCYLSETDDGTDMVFWQGGTPQHCLASGGVWGSETIINPNAPSVFKYSWLGAGFGSLIRPLGGIMADRYGGANITMLLIVWCFVATICTGVLIQKIYADRTPEDLFGWFVFMFINLFFTVGAMNGSTFGTIGVLFEKDLAGTVLGWSSAIASFGAFLIPSMFSVAFKYNNAQAVLYGLAAFYFLCGILNYYYYVRPNAERPHV